MVDTYSPLFTSARQPPSNVQAEMHLLGAILANNHETYSRISGFLRAEHFADETNSRCYAAIERKIGAGQVADGVSLVGEFEPAYLASLLASMIAPLLCPDYARVVLDQYLRRQMIAAADEMRDAAHGQDAGCDAPDLIAAAQDRIAAISQEAAVSKGRRSSMSIGEAMMRVEHRSMMIHKGKIPSAISTGIPGLDRMLGGGIPPATFTIVGGLEQHGKTDLILQIAENIALEQLVIWQQHRRGACPGVLFFEFEMTADQLAARTTARLGGINRWDIRRGKMTDDVTAGFREAARIGELLPLQIEDGTPVTLGRFRSALRQFMRRRPCVLAVVDNVTRMVDSSGIANKDAAYSQIWNELDNASKVTGVPIVALSHLLSGAAHEQRRPRRDDIPFLGGRYADQAFLVYRPELSMAPAPPDRIVAANGMPEAEEAWARKVNQWHNRKAETRNVTEIIPAKQREDDGQYHPEMVKLIYDRDTSRFVDPSAQPASPLIGSMDEEI